MKYDTLNKILNNKLVTSSTREFYSEIDIDVYTFDLEGDKNLDVQIYTKSVNIKWELELEERSYGVKGLGAHFLTKEISISYEIEHLDKEVKAEEGQIDLDISNVNIEYDRGDYPCFFPSSLQITLAGKKSDPSTWKATEVNCTFAV
jgi:hypothetical protein